MFLTWTRTVDVVSTGPMTATTAPDTTAAPATATAGAHRFAGPRTGASLALVSMLTVQLGIAVAVGLIDDVGAAGAAWLRLAWAGVLLLVIVRPRRAQFSRSSFGAAVALGVATASVTL